MPLPAMLVPWLIKLGAAAATAFAGWLVAKGHVEAAAAVGTVTTVVLSESKPIVKGRRKPDARR